MPYAIEAEKIIKNYGRIKALDSLSLNVNQGEIFGFLGPNGAGKSTFVKILLNLVKPSKGSASILGKPVSKHLSRRDVGFLPENMRVYNFLIVEEFLRFHAELFEVPRKNIKSEVEKALRTVGFYDERKRRMGTLSKGMTQKAGIAQAILGRPKLLLLDEPTSGLDPVGIKELRSILIEMKNHGTTIFLNSHLLSEVERTCDNIAILNNGKIVQVGSTADISGNNKHLELTVDGFNEDMEREINSLSVKNLVNEGNSLKVYLKDYNETLNVHKLINEKGGKVISFFWKGESLEEIFYDLVKKKDS
jgi:ABC-2 type transport system ATP-binding protein